MKRIVIVVLLVLVVSMSVFANAKAESRSSGKEQMIVWLPKTFSAEADEILKARCLEFAKEKNVDMETEFISAVDGYAKWNAAIESGEYPDLSYIHINTVANYGGRGLLADLSDVISKVEKNYSPMIKNHKANMELNGKYYSIPLYTQLNSVTYRTDVLAKAGYTEPPKSWKDYLEFGAKIKETSPDMYAFGNSLGVADDGEEINQFILRSFGAYFWDEKGNVVVDSPEAVEAVRFLAEMYQKRYMPPSVIEWDAGGNNTSYLSGESAVVVNPPTLYKAANSGDHAKTLGKVTKICPLPTDTPYDVWVCCGYVNFSVFEGANQKDLAKELLEYLFEKEWYEDLISMGFPVVGPVFVETTKAEVWQSEVGQGILPQGDLGRRYGSPSSDPRVIVADAQSINEFVVSKTLQKVILSNMSPEQAVSELGVYLFLCKWFFITPPEFCRGTGLRIG